MIENETRMFSANILMYQGFHEIWNQAFYSDMTSKMILASNQLSWQQLYNSTLNTWLAYTEYFFPMLLKPRFSKVESRMLLRTAFCLVSMTYTVINILWLQLGTVLSFYWFHYHRSYFWNGGLIFVFQYVSIKPAYTPIRQCSI